MIDTKYLGLHRADVMARLLDEAEKERDALRARIEAMEQQEPLDAGSDVFRSAFEAALKAGNWPATRQGDGYRSPSTQIAWRIAFSTVNRLKLYLAPGAQAQPAKNAVAYLDLGTGGYMDVGTDLTDEELAALPKGRHMLGIVGTYGVDGYSPAQPAPSVPDGWETDLLIVEHAMRMNNWDRNSNTSDDLKRSAYKIISKLLAAPEAKP